MAERAPVTLAELAQVLGAELRADGDAARLTILGVGPLASAGPGEVSFYTHSRYRAELARTRAAAVILAPENLADLDAAAAALVVANPQLAFSRAARLLQPRGTRRAGIHPSAQVSADAEIDPRAWVGPNSVVEAGARVAAGVSIGPNCSVGERVRIGRDSELAANVTLCRGVTLGSRVRVQPGAVIGSEGFGLAFDGERWEGVPQLGSVTVGDDVDIGANTTIDRGALDDTVIETGVKLDNQIQVAHNVRIGAHTAIAGCVGIAGSARIGRYCMIGGGVGIAGHLSIADRVTVTGMSLVARSITEPGVYSSGLTVEENRTWNRISARLRRIDELARKLQQQLRRQRRHDR